MAGIFYFIIIIIISLAVLLNKKIKTFYYNYLSEILTAYAGVGMTLCDIMSDSETQFVGDLKWKNVWGYLLILFSIMLLVAIVVSAKRNETNRKIADEIEKNKNLLKKIEVFRDEYYKLCSNNIRFLFKDFLKSGSERISIYKFNNDHFTLLGRYSKAPLYNKRTDYNYSTQEGLIGKGWLDGSAYISGAPECQTRNKKPYNDFMKQRCKITDKRLDRIKMKSRSIYVYTLHDDSTAEDPDGIIVFESTNPNKVVIADCESMINQKNSEILHLLKNMKNLTDKIT